MGGSARRIAFLLNKLIRDNCPSTMNKVYPPGIRQDSAYPRVIVNVTTPEQQFAAMGTGTGGYPTWRNYSASLEIFTAQPQHADIIAEEIEDAVAKNPSYRQTTIALTDMRGVTSTVNANGYFIMNRVTGGSITEAMPSFGAYRRTVRVSGRFLQTA